MMTKLNMYYYYIQLKYNLSDFTRNQIKKGVNNLFLLCLRNLKAYNERL